MAHPRDRGRYMGRRRTQSWVGGSENQPIKRLRMDRHNQISISISSEEGSPSTPLAQAESYSILSAKKSPTLSRSFLKTSASLLSARFKGTGDFDRANRVENASWYQWAPGQKGDIAQRGLNTPSRFQLTSYILASDSPERQPSHHDPR